MGIDKNGARFLLYAKLSGVDFSSTMMIGRQSLHLKPSELAAAVKQFGFTCDQDTIEMVYKRDQGYADEFIRCIGGQRIDSIDYSSYEGATHIHDMNMPVAQELHGGYTAVLDGGSLEHVFNFAVSVKSGMEMVAEGGHYLAITPMNNFVGHGFYQFSPELFFQVFTPVNGYRLVSLFAFAAGSDRWYRARDPRESGNSVTLVNSKPTFLLVIAKRERAVNMFETWPQQSDFAPQWAAVERASCKMGDAHLAPAGNPRIRDHLPPQIRSGIRILIARVRYLVFRVRRHFLSPFSSDCFSEFQPLGELPLLRRQVFGRDKITK